MSLTQQIIIIAVVVGATLLSRFLPFIIFPAGRPIPNYVRYLGRYLPPAVFAMLVVYCLRNVDVMSGNHGWPEFLGVAVTAGLHLWRRQMLLSIAGGTVFYMIVVQLWC